MIITFQTGIADCAADAMGSAYLMAFGGSRASKPRNWFYGGITATRCSR
jgi:hypothetical protein